jgi:D-sedoheptulose 7-phosphate isomerase/D-glycero-D-manno-heptose 1,7-bisphosphate phosphatase
MTTTFDLPGVATGTSLPAQKFPAAPYDAAGSFCAAYFEEFGKAAASIDWLEVERAARVLTVAYTRQAGVFSCGNGGSAAIANHLQCDHLKGVRTETDLLPRVVSLSSNVELLTAIANDIGYEDVFSFQLESQSRPGDVLIAISSSGRSPNIIRALSWAREHDVRTIALTGFSGGGARDIAEAAIHVDCTNYGVVEDLHQAAMHAMAQYIRQSRMTADAIAVTTF